MNNAVALSKVSRSWKDLPQDVAPRTTPLGRRRALFQALRLMLTLAAIGVAGWGIYALAHTWARDPKKITGGAQTIPMKDPKFIPDPAGVVDEGWLERTVANPAGSPVPQL